MNTEEISLAYWAFIDDSGNIVSWGQCAPGDMFRQEIPDGLTAVSRPDYVNGYDHWTFKGGEWKQENT